MRYDAEPTFKRNSQLQFFRANGNLVKELGSGSILMQGSITSLYILLRKNMIYLPVEVYTTVAGRTAKNISQGFAGTQMEVPMMETGLMVNNKGRVLCVMLMDRYAYTLYDI